MYIQKLALVQFKNYQEVIIDLHPKLNCFVGNNGVGKTNLLDAIYYLCMCKSYFNTNDTYSIRNSEEFMVLQANLLKNDKPEEIYCGLQRERKKQFRRNKKEYSKLSDHIGLFPVVMVSPSDSQLITEGSEERRKYMNSVISQYDRVYLDNTIRYNKVLAQRNRLLKDSFSNADIDDLLDIFDEQLIVLGTEIYNSRLRFIDDFTPVFNRYYRVISEGKETVELIYHSDLKEADFSVRFLAARPRDKQVQYTNLGIHKDDLLLDIDGMHIKRAGSQGQQKTYLVSLKLAQFEFLKNVHHCPPLLLLDDIFDKFDANRVRQILKLVDAESFGQIFITHTNLDRMNSILHELKIDHKLFMVNEGKVTEVKESESVV